MLETPFQKRDGFVVFLLGDEQASGADAAVEFLKTQEETWTKWVPADVAAKVKAAL